MNREQILEALRTKRPELFAGDELAKTEALSDADLHALLEATTKKITADSSLDDRQRAVSNAVREKYGKTGGIENEYVWPEVTFDDKVIIRKGQKLFSVGYKFNAAGEVEFSGEPVEVRELPRAFEVVKEARDNGRPADGWIIGPVMEAADKAPSGAEWDIVVAESGLSENRNLYDPQVLSEAAALYEGARIYADHEEGARRYGRSVHDLVGFLKDVKAVEVAHEAKGASKTALAAKACITRKSLREDMLEAWRLGKVDLFGFSHVVEAKHQVVMLADGPARKVERIRKVKSVDLVTTPAAGGRVVSLAESTIEEDGRMLKKLLEQLRALNRPDLLEALGENPTEDQVLEAVQKALQAAPARTDAAPPATPPAQPAAPAAPQVTESDLATLREARTVIASLRVERDLAETAGLPDKLKERIRKRMTARIEAGNPPSQEEITGAIREAVEDFGALAESGIVMPHVGKTRVEIMKGRREKLVEAFDSFFDPEKPARSIRELYVEMTGDKRFTGRIEEATHLSEAIDSTTFAQALGDSITRRMLAYYREPAAADWRLLANVVPLGDFRTQRRIRFGGYLNLPIVNQGQPYLAMVSPTDEEAIYAPAKRGGTETVTLEAIRNDDVGAIRAIPLRIAKAARQTLHQFVFDFLRTNPLIYDGANLLAAGHGNNLLVVALSAANLNTLRLRMRQQADMSSGQRLGLAARHLWVPQELEELAFQLTTSDKVTGSANNDPNFLKKVGITPHTVDYWTDTNDYFVTADKTDCPIIEIGFLDGQEEPEIFVQDMPNVGSMFTNDQLTWKIRHIYGGAVMDYRGVAGSIVP